MKSNNFEWLLPTPAQGDSWRWGRYVGPLQVEFSPGTITWVTESLVNPEVGQRVLVRFYSGTRATIMGVLGGIGDKPVVTALPLKNGWTGYGGGYQHPEYEVFPDGHVQLHGMITPGTKANNTVIATVPASLAPYRRRVFVVGAGGLGAARVDVNPTGEILLAVFGATSDAEKITWLSLETVSW